MQIHLSELSSVDGASIRVLAEPSLDFLEIHHGNQEGERYPVLSRPPLDLTVTNVGEQVLEIEGTGEITLGIPCSRCLQEVKVTLPLSFSRKVDLKLTENEEGYGLDENSCLSGTDLDVDRLVYLEILTCWPEKVLCREDCKGICSRCGKNLNEGPCHCQEEPGDPRMAAIRDIFREFKEV